MMPCAEEIPAVRGQTPITRSIKITVTSCCYGQQTAKWLMKTNCCSDGHCKVSLFSSYGHIKGSKLSLLDGSDVSAVFSHSRCFLVVFFRFTCLKSLRDHYYWTTMWTSLKQPLNTKYVIDMHIQSRTKTTANDSTFIYLFRYMSW